MSKAIDRKEASKERLLADLEHLRFTTIEKAGEGVKRLFGPNSLAAELEAEAQVPPADTTETTPLTPNNTVSLAAERAVRMSGMDSIRASVEAAHEAEVQEGYQGGVEEFPSTIAA